MGNAPSSVPYAAQSNIAQIPLTCDYNPTGTAVYDTTIALTAPLSGGAGQQINITDVTAKIFLAGEIKVYLYDSALYRYTVDTSITFNVTNASPSTFTIYEYNTEHNLTSSDFSDRSDLQIDFPAKGETATGVLPPIGPITLGARGQSDVQLSQVRFSLQAFSTSGRPVFGQQRSIITCQPQPQYILASIPVDDSPVGPLLAPANNAPTSHPPTASGQQSTTASIPVSCTQDILNPNTNRFNYTFNYTVSATGPLIAQNGQAFNLTNVNNYLTVPGEIAYYSTALYGPGTCGLFVRVKPENDLLGLGFIFANAAPDVIDASYNFVASDASTPNPLVTGRYVDCQNRDSVLFPFPNLGHLDLVNLKPNNQSGSVFGVKFLNIQGEIEGINARFGLAGNERWICIPQGRSVLLSAPIV